MSVQVGQIYRDTYYDKEQPSKRTIRILDVRDDRVLAESVTFPDGEPVEKPRKTSMSLKTLSAGYEFQPSDIK